MLVAALALPISGCAEGPEPNAVETVASAVVQPDTTTVNAPAASPEEKVEEMPLTSPDRIQRADRLREIRDPGEGH